MAKMFCTVPQAAKKLNMTEEEVEDLIEQGQFQRFVDRTTSMLKVEQVDLFAQEIAGTTIKCTCCSESKKSEPGFWSQLAAAARAIVGLGD